MTPGTDGKLLTSSSLMLSREGGSSSKQILTIGKNQQMTEGENGELLKLNETFSEKPL